MQPDKLSSHVFKKGVFITPINSIPLMHELSDKNLGHTAECLNIFGLV